MAIWVRAICRKSVADGTPEELRAGIAERLPRMAALYGESDVEATVARLRVEAEPGGAGDPEERGSSVWQLRYRGDDQRSVRVERWSDPARVEGEVKELLEGLEDCDEDGVGEVRSALTEAVETVAFELAMSDTEGMGWPVVIAAAACLARRGNGLVQADGEGWMEPDGLDLEHLIDAD
jgi:hypothetical protein